MGTERPIREERWSPDPARPRSATSQSISIFGKLRRLREFSSSFSNAFSTLVAAWPRCAVSPSCTRSGVTSSGHLGTLSRPADCKSAIQQSATLRYIRPTVSIAPPSAQHVNILRLNRDGSGKSERRLQIHQIPLHSFRGIAGNGQQPRGFARQK